MKYQAVFFDLGGTLIRSPGWSGYADVARKMASILTAPVEDFVELWLNQSSGLGTGEYHSYQDYIRHICRQLRVEVQDSQVDSAASIPLEMTKRVMMDPQEGALEVLNYLKSNGYKIGLISDCGPDVPALWNETPLAPFFDVTVFSCSAGLVKSDTRIFELAIEKLDVTPERCVYVADGMRKELASAAELGMYALQIRVPGEADQNPLNEDWNGPVISSLTELIPLLG